METHSVYVIGGTFGAGSSVWPIALTGLVTAVGAFAVGRLLESYRRHCDMRGMANALLAEITAIQQLVVEQHLEERYREVRAVMQKVQAEAATWPSSATEALVFPVTVYEKCADRIGMLDEQTAAGVVHFYNYLAGFRSGVRIALGPSELPIKGRIDTVDFILKILDEEMPKVKRLQGELRDLAAQRWRVMGAAVRPVTAVLLACGLLAGCAGGQRGPTLAERVQAAPLPTTEDGRQADCGNIRMTIADQRSRGQMAGAMLTNPLMVQAAQRQVMLNITALENRAAMERCPAAFSGTASDALPHSEENGKTISTDPAVPVTRPRAAWRPPSGMIEAGKAERSGALGAKSTTFAPRPALSSRLRAAEDRTSQGKPCRLGNRPPAACFAAVPVSRRRETVSPPELVAGGQT